MAKIDPRWAEGSAYNIIQELAIGFQKSQILFAAMQYDIFSVIGDGYKTVDSIAKIIGVNEKALDRLLNALVAIKLLNKHELYYENTELANKHLVKKNPAYYGFLLHTADLWESWGTLSNVIKTGEFETNKTINEKDERWIADFLISLDYKAKMELELVMKHIPLQSIHKMLDLGAGSGRYALEIAKNNPNIDTYIFDYPNVIEIAKKMIQNEFAGNNMNFLSGDLLVDDFGSQYDCIFISSVLHDYSIIENIDILSRVYKALKRGGKLVIHQMIINDDRTSPMLSALQSINLLVNTPAGNSYTYADIWVVLKEAGFGELEFLKTDFGTQVIIASKSILG